ncbi:MAG: lysophospholipid acyltransferase family protein, partial [Gammaproteobacteria bacterium]
ASHLDSPSIAVACGLPIDSLIFLAAKDYDFGYAKVLMNIAPFDRTLEMVGLLHNVQDCRYYTEQGKHLVIFPEGTRSPTGKMQPFKSAVALIAAELGLPIVPVYISGAYGCLPRGHLFPRRGRITVNFGAPLYVKRDEAGDYQAYKTISATLREHIEALK